MEPTPPDMKELYTKVVNAIVQLDTSVSRLTDSVDDLRHRLRDVAPVEHRRGAWMWIAGWAALVASVVSACLSS